MGREALNYPFWWRTMFQSRYMQLSLVFLACGHRTHEDKILLLPSAPQGVTLNNFPTLQRACVPSFFLGAWGHIESLLHQGRRIRRKLWGLQEMHVFKSWLCHFLTAWSWANYLPVRYLKWCNFSVFPSEKWGYLLIVQTSEDFHEI
jgi:hypothetical protein